MAIILSEKAASEVKRIIDAHQQSGEVPGQIYLRMRIVGGGCSGFQHKLDLDPQVDAQRDETFDLHGVPVAIDKRSLIYLENVTVDFHEDQYRRGFSSSNPTAKSTCGGCGSSYGM